MRNILVVDDDMDMLEMVTILLTTAGAMNVCGIGSADTLFEQIGRFRPDLILMDIYLGDQDGRHLCQTFKTSGEFRDIPVILYSAGHITATSVKDALADAFIAKPFDMNELFEKIDSLLR